MRTTAHEDRHRRSWDRLKDDEEFETMPDDAERAFWLADSFHWHDFERHGADVFEDIDEEDLEDMDTIVFEQGDELPLPVADDLWPQFGEVLSAYDADGNRVDVISRQERQQWSDATAVVEERHFTGQ